MPTQVLPSTSSRRRLHVLIVDDAPQVREELSVLLQLMGDLEVVGEAANGLEAISQAQTLRPDVVVMDLEMPVLDGYAATRQIKTRCPACRIVVLTIHGDETARQRANEAGADDFVVKGAPVDVILRAITNERSY
jgi:pilus assembly protein CpaE